MTIGPDNLSNSGNGAAKTEDRFAGQLGYRPRSSRDGGPLSGSPLSASVLSLDGADDRMHPLDIANPIASTMAQPKLADAGLTGLREPALDSPLRDAPSLSAWLDSPSANVADHPLLRGLLLELPSKGSTLDTLWLDRWFEAARSILELLYRFQDGRD